MSITVILIQPTSVRKHTTSSINKSRPLLIAAYLEVGLVIPGAPWRWRAIGREETSSAAGSAKKHRFVPTQGIIKRKCHKGKKEALYRPCSRLNAYHTFHEQLVSCMIFSRKKKRRPHSHTGYPQQPRFPLILTNHLSHQLGSIDPSSVSRRLVGVEFIPFPGVKCSIGTRYLPLQGHQVNGCPPKRKLAMVSYSLLSKPRREIEAKATHLDKRPSILQSEDYKSWHLHCAISGCHGPRFVISGGISKADSAASPEVLT
ncbi:hypothetical protein QBC38DRAFT_69263 [Podospora fimiseda]|uniref:Uncharacterized protein n=1 Tax=Podospora fimiseda TaxID=252190 RepID=A0AAN7BV56_9PEZI|nr:hypothetical protein QBC38DRAFT_69263 [Podospora fimiseda]